MIERREVVPDPTDAPVLPLGAKRNPRAHPRGWFYSSGSDGIGLGLVCCGHRFSFRIMKRHGGGLDRSLARCHRREGGREASDGRPSRELLVKLEFAKQRRGADEGGLLLIAFGKAGVCLTTADCAVSK